METLYLALGRNGDILAALPLVQHQPNASLMVSAEYAPLLEGTSVTRILWTGDWRCVRAAYESVKGGWKRIVVLQQYSIDGWPSFHGTDSYVKDMYRVARKLSHFPLPLRFDRRSPEREAHWIAGLPSDKPLILVATCGLSSPFAMCEELRHLVQSRFPNAHVINLDAIRAERLYDLIALLERAACLVTIDSALLHLAQAVPNLPVVALIADRPTLWHGSPQYAGQCLRVRYSDYAKRTGAIVEAIGACLVAAPAVGAG
jgi:ADP-heptose:LPS heptosyltransferase